MKALIFSDILKIFVKLIRIFFFFLRLIVYNAFSLTYVYLIIFFISEEDHYKREFPDLPRQTKFWREVFHNGFKCDYYNKYFDGQCHEILDRVYMILTQEYHHNAFISVFEVSMKLKHLINFYLKYFKKIIKT